MTPFSILDLVPVTEGSDARTAFANMIDLARLGERLGYRRYWLAEHHNMPGIASAATAVLIGHVAGHTSAIRVGSRSSGAPRAQLDAACRALADLADEARTAGPLSGWLP